MGVVDIQSLQKQCKLFPKTVWNLPYPLGTLTCRKQGGDSSLRWEFP